MNDFYFHMFLNFYHSFMVLVAPPASGSIAPAISLSDKAFNHLNKMRVDKNEDLCLRIGVKQGGCSGMSYTMEFENRANTRLDDSLIEYKGFTIGMILFHFLSLDLVLITSTRFESRMIH